jgi:hypothetical protein
MKVLAILVAALVVGCTESKNNSSDKTVADKSARTHESEHGTVTLREVTRLPESADGFVSVSVEAEALTFTFSDQASAKAVAIEEGSVLVGATDEGYLRHAVVVVQDGAEVWVETVDAKLTDALEEADITIDVEFEGEWVEVVDEDVADEGVPDDLLPRPESFSFSAGYLFGGVELLDESADEFNYLGFHQLSVGGRPRVRWNTRIEDGEETLSELEFTVHLWVDGKFKAMLSDEVSYSGDVLLVKGKKTTLVWIGFFPVPVTGVLTATNKISATAHAAGKVSTYFDGDVYFGIEAKKRHGDWTTNSWFDGSMTGGRVKARKPARSIIDSIHVGAHINSKVGMEFEPGVHFYGIAGAYATVEPYFSGDICTPGGWSLDWGVDGAVQVRSKFFDDPFEPYSYEYGPESLEEWWDEAYCADEDGDGHGDSEVHFDHCDATIDWVKSCEDCDDADDLVHGEATGGLAECEAVKDLDCDGGVDQPSAVNWTVSRTGWSESVEDLCDGWDSGSGSIHWTFGGDSGRITDLAPSGSSAFVGTDTANVTATCSGSVRCSLSDSETYSIWCCSEGMSDDGTTCDAGPHVQESSSSVIITGGGDSCMTGEISYLDWDLSWSSVWPGYETGD